MTNEEAVSALILMRDDCLSKHEYDDTMRVIKFQALTVAIRSIDNQPKYEKALNDVCAWIAKNVDIDCHGSDCRKDVDCIKCSVEYYKHKAGIDKR